MGQTCSLRLREVQKFLLDFLEGRTMDLDYSRLEAFYSSQPTETA